MFAPVSSQWWAGHLPCTASQSAHLVYLRQTGQGVKDYIYRGFMRPTWRVRHIDPVPCPRVLVSSFGGDVDIDAKAIVVEGELVDDQGVLVQNIHLATNTVVRLDQVSNKLNLIERGWPLIHQPAVWEKRTQEVEMQNIRKSKGGVRKIKMEI